MKDYRLKTALNSLALFIALTVSSGVHATEISEHDSHGSESPHGYAGVLLGGSSPTGSNGNTATTVGATLGAKLAPAFGIGLYGSYYGQTSSGSLMGLPTGTSSNTIVVTGQGNFFAGGLHIGGEAGPAFSSWSGHVSSLHTGSSTTAMVYGPEAGYDLIIAKAMSIGAEAHYLLTNADGGADNIQFLAALKAWL